MMTVNGWQLPEAYAAFFETKRHSRWHLVIRELPHWLTPLFRQFSPRRLVSKSRSRCGREGHAHDGKRVSTARFRSVDRWSQFDR